MLEDDGLIRKRYKFTVQLYFIYNKKFYHVVGVFLQAGNNYLRVISAVKEKIVSFLIVMRILSSGTRI